MLKKAQCHQCKIFFPLLPTFRIIGTLMHDAFLCQMEKCVFFILRFWNIKDASEYKWSHCEQMEATWLRRLKRI